MKKQIEIEDNLSEIVNNAIENVRDLLLDFLKENPDVDDVCLNNDLDYAGSVHEIIDSSVPINTHIIKGLWFLYDDDFIESYENAGIGNNVKENNGMTAIYCYISDKVNEWFSDNVENIIEDFKKNRLYEIRKEKCERYI
jgi:hypothetical protein